MESQERTCGGGSSWSLLTSAPAIHSGGSLEVRLLTNGFGLPRTFSHFFSTKILRELRRIPNIVSDGAKSNSGAPATSGAPDGRRGERPARHEEFTCAAANSGLA